MKKGVARRTKLSMPRAICWAKMMPGSVPSYQMKTRVESASTKPIGTPPTRLSTKTASMTHGAAGIALGARTLHSAQTASKRATAPAAPWVMLAVFVLSLVGGVPIGFVLALSTLVFIWYEGTLPGIIFAQQMARGIDNFVLLAIPFFILVGYMMEANGMSVRLIELLHPGVCRLRGGPTV